MEIAFRTATGLNQELRIVGSDGSPLVVYFPTEKETFLGFLIQGPYRTTPARDNVPAHDPSNQALVRETAALLADVLRELRDEGLLTAEVLRAMPIDPVRFQPGTMFRALFEKVRDALSAEELVPAADGAYGLASRLKLAGAAELRELLRPAQLGVLYGGGQPVGFVDPAITADGTPLLRQYLRDEIGVEEITPEAVVGRLTGEFLEAQSDEWITEFYAFLYRHPSLWERARGVGALRRSRSSGWRAGSQVRPFRRGRPRGCIPAGLAGRARSRRYEGLSLTSLPPAGSWRRSGSPSRTSWTRCWRESCPGTRRLEVADLDAAQHDADIESVARAMTEAGGDRRERLLDQLRRTRFLVGENAATGEQRLMTPGSLYQRSKELELYFDGNPEAWFAGDGYGPWLVQLRGMGVRDAVEVRARPRDALGYVLVADEFARHERGLEGFDPAAEVDGLEFALSHPGHGRSEYIWNVLLVPHSHLVAGVVETSHRESFVDAERSEAMSAIGIVAAREAWLPGPDGVLCRPAEVRLDQLPAGFAQDETLARSLGMAQSVVEEAARQLGLSPELLRGLSENPDLVALVERELNGR